MSGTQDEQIITSTIKDIEVNSAGVVRRGQRRSVRSVNNQPSMTKQADRAGACIHKILDKFKKTGLLPQRTVEPLSGKIPDIESFHEAMSLVVNAQQQFDALPSDLRAKFHNNPQEFVEFVNNPENVDQLIEMGLATAQAPQEPIQVSVVSSPTGS